MARIRWSVTSKGMAFGPLVSSEWLLDHLGQRDVVVVDCRFVLGSPGAGRSAWEEAHIPTAHFLDVDEDLSAPAGGASGTAGSGAGPGAGATAGSGAGPGSHAAAGFPSGGRHPLPSAADFAVAAARAGIGEDSTVVAYDEAGEGGAARLWWLLRHFGHESQAVLDGGLRGWRAMGGREDDLPPRPWALGPEFSPRARDDDVAVASEVEQGLGDSALALVDARAAPRFRGDVEPIDPVAGHIPSA